MNWSNIDNGRELSVLIFVLILTIPRATSIEGVAHILPNCT